MNEGSDCPHSKGSSAETEQINPVSGLVRLSQKGVSVPDIVFESVANCHSQEPCKSARDRAKRAKRLHGSNPRVVKRDLVWSVLNKHGIELDHIRAVFCKLVRCSVTADDDVFGSPFT